MANSPPFVPPHHIFTVRDNNMVTTSEHVALVIFKIISPKLPSYVSLHRVKVSDYDQDYSEIIAE